MAKISFCHSALTQYEGNLIPCFFSTWIFHLCQPDLMEAYNTSMFSQPREHFLFLNEIPCRTTGLVKVAPSCPLYSYIESKWSGAPLTLGQHHGRRNFKDINPLMSSLLVILFGVVKQFCRFWIWSETERKTPAEYGPQYISTIEIDTLE